MLVGQRASPASRRIDIDSCGCTFWIGSVIVVSEQKYYNSWPNASGQLPGSPELGSHSDLQFLLLHCNGVFGHHAMICVEIPATTVERSVCLF